MTLTRRGVVVLLILAAIVGFTSHYTFANAAPNMSHAKVYKRAEHMIAYRNIHVPWDGRYSHRNGRFCIETFNGTDHDIRQYGHGVPSGFYLKFCSDGNYYVNDGQAFKGMVSY